MTPPRLLLRLRREPPRPLVLTAASARAIAAVAKAPAPRAGQGTAAAHPPAAPIRLYDLQVDPGEQHDVASAHPREAARLTQMLRELRTRPPIARSDSGAAAQP